MVLFNRTQLENVHHTMIINNSLSPNFSVVCVFILPIYRSFGMFMCWDVDFFLPSTQSCHPEKWGWKMHGPVYTAFYCELNVLNSK